MIEVRNYGNPNAKIMLIGEAPGEQEEREGKPFVGPAGQILRKHMLSAGIDPEDCYFANLTPFRPPANKLREWFSDKGLPNEIVLDGMARLAREIEQVRPNIIVPLGNYPLAMVTGKARWIKGKLHGKPAQYYTGIHDWRGSIVPSRIVEGFKCVPTFHPSYILREGRQDHGAWDVDWQRIKNESAFSEIRRPWASKELLIVRGVHVQRIIFDDLDGRTYHLESTSYTRDELRDWLLHDMSLTLTVDIERISGKLLCVGMTVSRDRAVVVATQNISDVEFVRSILCSGIKLNAQNSMFEVSIMDWHYGMEIMPAVGFDTMLAAHAANIELPKDLGYLDSIYTDQPYYKDMVNWKKVTKGQQPVVDVLVYNSIDVWTQHEVMEEQIKWDLDEQATLDTFEFEMALLPPLWEISKRGMRIDREHLRKLTIEADEKMRRASALLSELSGVPDFNVKGQEVVKLLFHQLRMKPIKWTDGGKPSTDDKALAEMEIDAANEIEKMAIRAIRDGRSARSRKEKLLEVEFDSDWRSRGMYNPGGTDTGRLGSKKFYPTEKGIQQQNVPRKGEVRMLFIPDEGMEFGYLDLERAESLVVAELTQDLRMLRDHMPGQDAHVNLAMDLFSLPREEITEDRRYMGKQTRHAGNYMEGPRTFMVNVNKYAHDTGVSVTYSEADFFIKRYRELHPGLPRWWDEIKQELWRTQTLYNLLGRRRIFYGHVNSIIPAAVAFVPQSTVGDVLNVGLLNASGVKSPYIRKLGIWDEYEETAARLREAGVQLLNQVHDSVCFQYQIGKRDEILPLLRKLFSVPLTSPKTLQTFRIPVEVKYGKPSEGRELTHPGGSWGECKVYTADLTAA